MRVTLVSSSWLFVYFLQDFLCFFVVLSSVLLCGGQTIITNENPYLSLVNLWNGFLFALEHRFKEFKPVSFFQLAFLADFFPRILSPQFVQDVGVSGDGEVVNHSSQVFGRKHARLYCCIRLGLCWHGFMKADMRISIKV